MNKFAKINISQWLFGLAVIIYIAWAGRFIFNSSFIAIDGHRYFSLVDDAMISMRYAWNFSHGLGLVWNAGERVEGYSNFLMTLVMAAITWLFDKRSAVLAVQILGIPTVILSAFLAREISREVFGGNPRSVTLSLAVFVFTLLYYPLSFWSLMGMETGLVTVCTLAGALWSLRWTRSRRARDLFLSAAFLGLAFLTRNDALLFAVIVFASAAWTAWIEKDKARARDFLLAGILYAAFVLGLLLFRWLYYGALVPNTYTLKLGQIPLSVRVNDGMIYIAQFIKETWLVLLAALVGLFVLRDRRKWFLVAFAVAAILYQIWTGGDAWGRWRFLVPALPLLLVLATGAADTLAQKFSTGRPRALAGAASLGLLLTSLLVPYWGEVTFSRAIADYAPNLHNVNVAIAINSVTAPEATIGVFYAGVIPYYTDRYAFDFLGKSDVHIAELYPHLPPAVTWFQRTTLPGHNKYDLRYSIMELQPTYIQRYYWGEQNIRGYAIQNYVRLEYSGANGSVTLMLKKDSPNVYWDRGTLLPWGE